MHAMRFIKVKDDNNLTPLEEDSQERSRRRMTLNLAESNRVADLCNEIRRHAAAIRQERTRHEKIISEETSRRQTGRRDYLEARAKADNIRKARDIFHSNSYEDIKWRQKLDLSLIHI